MDIYSKALATINSAEDSEDKYGPSGGFTAILSTGSLDRDNEHVKRHEWKEPLPERVPLDADHGMKVADTIGSFRPYFDGDTLMMEARFASTAKAQEVRTLVTEGHINTVSVAMMNDRTAKKDGGPFRELLNAGVVAVPANKDAVILDSKALDTRARELIMEKVDIKDLPTGFVLDGLIKTHSPDNAFTVITEDGEQPKKGIYVNVIPRIDEDAMKRVTAEVLAKAGAGTGDLALLQAIHDASVHLGAICAACEELHADDVPAAAKPAAPAKSVDEETVSFSNANGQTIEFSSHVAAREFFTDMLKSIEDADENDETIVKVESEVKTATLEVEVPEGVDLDEFKTRLAEITNTSSEESPADSPPADEAAAASVEEPAPAEAAVDEAADPMTVQRRANHLELLLFASES